MLLEETGSLDEELILEENPSELQKLVNQEQYSLIDEDDLTNPEDDETIEEEVQAPGPNHRYFADESSVKCHNCYRRGHSKQYCPFNAMVCNYCLGPHERKHCINELFCFNCGGKDHVRNECNVKDKDKCFRCNKAHHIERDCFYVVMTGRVVDSYHINNVLCLACGKKGHPNCSMKVRRDLYIKNDDLYGREFKSRLIDVHSISKRLEKQTAEGDSVRSFDSQLQKKRSRDDRKTLSNDKRNRNKGHRGKDRSKSNGNNQKHKRGREETKSNTHRREGSYNDLYGKGRGNVESRNSRGYVDMTVDSSNSKNRHNSAKHSNNGSLGRKRHNRGGNDRRWVDRS